MREPRNAVRNIVAGLEGEGEERLNRFAQNIAFVVAKLETEGAVDAGEDAAAVEGEEGDGVSVDDGVAKHLLVVLVALMAQINNVADKSADAAVQRV